VCMFVRVSEAVHGIRERGLFMLLYPISLAASWVSSTHINTLAATMFKCGGLAGIVCDGRLSMSVGKGEIKSLKS